MKRNDSKPNHPPMRHGCRQTRLAQGAVAAVDMCECGMIQLHVGAITLRLEPRALSELLATLGQAVAEHDRTSASEQPAAVPFRRRHRGEA
ncbi:MAG: hypothetical protein MJD61_05190 [Proteobacteria bacterium]|nr:hypothetical protein [Pseudomonadota bacterium]